MRKGVLIFYFIYDIILQVSPYLESQSFELMRKRASKTCLSLCASVRKKLPNDRRKTHQTTTMKTKLVLLTLSLAFVSSVVFGQQVDVDAFRHYSSVATGANADSLRKACATVIKVHGHGISTETERAAAITVLKNQKTRFSDPRDCANMDAGILLLTGKVVMNTSSSGSTARASDLFNKTASTTSTSSGFEEVLGTGKMVTGIWTPENPVPEVEGDEGVFDPIRALQYAVAEAAASKQSGISGVYAAALKVYTGESVTKSEVISMTAWLPSQRKHAIKNGREKFAKILTEVMETQKIPLEPASRKISVKTTTTTSTVTPAPALAPAPVSLDTPPAAARVKEEMPPPPPRRTGPVPFDKKAK